MIVTKTLLPKGAWLVVLLLFIVGALNYLDRTMITTMRSSIVTAIPMTDAQFGLLTAVFLWVYGILSPFAGFIADRFKRSRVIVGSLMVWSLVTWLTAHATTYEELLATRALMGISEACYIPAALALILDYHKGPTQSLATGLNISGVMVGQSLGFVGGLIAENHTWNLAFNIFGVVGVVYSIILLFILKDAPKDIPSVQKNSNPSECDEIPNENINFFEAIKSLFSKSSFVYILLFWCLMGVISWLVVAWLPTYYKEHFNLSQGMAGFCATAYLYPASIAGLLLGGFWADRWSRKNKYARIIVPMIGISIAAPCVFFASNTAVFYLVIVFFMVYGLTVKFVDTNLMPVLCMISDRRYRATGYGILNMFSTVAGGVGIYVTGALRDSHIDLGMVYRIASFTMIVCVLLLLMVIKSIKAE